jgi:serralysin
MAIINGNAANNTLNGTAMNDVIRGFAGNDRITGHEGADKMFGGSGNDTFVYHNFEEDGVYDEFGDLVGGADVISGGKGFDSIQLTGNSINLTKTMISSIEGVSFTNNENHRNTMVLGADQFGVGKIENALHVTGDTHNNNELHIQMGDKTSFSASSFTFSHWEGNGEYGSAEDLIVINGSMGNDKITGSSYNDELYGLEGNDRMFGGKGADLLDGGDGNDTLNGGKGNDVLEGGNGADRFVFSTALNGDHNVDYIRDFNAAEDSFLLKGSIFSSIDHGTLSADSFKMAGMGLDADDRIIYDSGTGNISYDADGSGAGAAVVFAQVSAGTMLSADNFHII